MSNLANILLSLNIFYVTIMASCFFIELLGADDELHQYAMNRALKLSTVITILSLLGYAFYKLASGSASISIHTIFFGIEQLSILTLLLYHLELKGFSLSFKIKSIKAANFLATISIVISVLATLSSIFKINFFTNPGGLIRYDRLILFANLLLLSLIIPLSPNAKLDRETYKKRERESKIVCNIFTIIYAVYMLAIIAYIVYRKAIL